MKTISKTVFGLFVLLLFLCCLLNQAYGQSASTAVILGTATDQSGAVVPDADATLHNTSTNEEQKQKTNSAGQYTFARVVPGIYRLTISKAGFATFVFNNITIEVAKNYTYDAKLQVRSTSEIIEVSAEGRVELQTTDSSIGNVIGGETLNHLPTLTRSAGELLTLQPGSTPYDSTQTGFGNGGGTVAGSRSDQNTFTLDGIDITDNVIAGGRTNGSVVPIGVETVDEFRVDVTNANATFGRSEGGQVALISKSGGNTYHGVGYWYHQNDDLNANTWDNNHLKIPRAEQRDNRAGFSAGGPIRKDKTFIFGNYEVRRFFQSFQRTRIVPSDDLRNGIIHLGGQTFNLATSTACGAGGTTACDPRGLGISPTVQQLWKLMPEGNAPNATGADGLNTIGFTAQVAAPLKDDQVSAKLDHNFTDKIHFSGRYLYDRDLTPNGGQIDLRGGTASNPSHSNVRGDGYTAGLSWQVRNNLNNTFRAGWIRSRQDFTVIKPSASASQLALPGTNTADGFIALAPGLSATGFLDTVVDVDTQRARHQAIIASNKQYADDLSWTRGKHQLTFGGDVRWLPTIHDRDDKVIGSLTSLVAQLDADVNGLLTIPAANRPPGLSPADQTRWDRLYAASLGLLNNVGILAVRNGSLQPKPFGTTLISSDTLHTIQFYGQDTWRMKPSFTVTYGLAYGWQTTPHELNQQQTFIVNHDNGDSIIDGFQYIQQKAAAAANGQFFNPTLAYLPIKNSGRSDVFNVDYGDLSPRLSAAWNPNISGGFLGHFFGGRKTVVRGGYGIAYDRVNTVQSVIIPMLGVGFAQTVSVIAPSCTASGAPGTSCNIDTTPGGSSFRVGRDGTIPLPATPGALTSPIVPGLGFSETLSFQNDPNFKVGRAHMVDFDIQRELPGNMLLELGYVGRFGRNLANSINFNSSPIMFKDTASGQTFAQAFDAVAAQLRAGVPCASVTPQPWFENLLPGRGTAGPGGIACRNTGNFVNGAVSSLFVSMDVFRFTNGLPTFNNFQVLDLFMRTSRDVSNYHAMVVTLHNRGWHGLQFDANYTYSKSLDQVGAVQNSASYYSSSFFTNFDYGRSFFDRPHIFNFIYNYDLPFGGSHRWSNHHSAINKMISGWYSAGIFHAQSGAPLLVTEGSQAFGGGLIFGFNNGEIPLVSVNSLNGGIHSPVGGSNGVGTAGDPTKCGANGVCGTGLNYFSDPATALKDFRPLLLSSDTRHGRDNPLRGLGLVNLDLRVGKITSLHERIKLEFSADLFNALNHVNFLDPSLNTQNPANFGVINTEFTPANRNSGARWIQFGTRLSF
jgi:hypothetical protein